MDPITDSKVDELARLDAERQEALSKAEELEQKSWPLFVELLVDEMLAKATELGHPDDLEYALRYYFTENRMSLLLQADTYFSQINDRLANARHSLEPFTTYLKCELESRGAPLRLESPAGWYDSYLTSIN